MNVKVNDEYIEAMGDYLKKGYELMNDFLFEYCKIMCDVLNDGIAEGETHKALSEFIKQVEISGEREESYVVSAGVTYHTYCDEFISEIAKADHGLYGS